MIDCIITSNLISMCSVIFLFFNWLSKWWFFLVIACWMLLILKRRMILFISLWFLYFMILHLWCLLWSFINRLVNLSFLSVTWLLQCFLFLRRWLLWWGDSNLLSNRFLFLHFNFFNWFLSSWFYNWLLLLLLSLWNINRFVKCFFILCRRLIV